MQHHIKRLAIAFASMGTLSFIGSSVYRLSTVSTNSKITESALAAACLVPLSKLDGHVGLVPKGNAPLRCKGPEEIGSPATEIFLNRCAQEQAEGHSRF